MLSGAMISMGRTLEKLGPKRQFIRVREVEFSEVRVSTLPRSDALGGPRPSGSDQPRYHKPHHRNSGWYLTVTLVLSRAPFLSSTTMKGSSTPYSLPIPHPLARPKPKRL